MRVGKPHRRQGEAHRSREQKTLRRPGERWTGPAAPQRIETPRGAGQQHQERPVQRRRSQSRQVQVHQPAQCGHQPDPLPRTRALARHQPRSDHRELHRAEQQQSAGARRQAHVGEREGRRVQEQEGRPGEATGRRDSGAATIPEQESEHQRAGGEANGREGRGIDMAGTQCQPREHRVRGKAQQRHRGQPDHGSGGVLSGG